jgi:hypothetical protein
MRNLLAAWIVVGLLLVGLTVASPFMPLRPGLPLDVLIRAAVAPLHERAPIN